MAIPASGYDAATETDDSYAQVVAARTGDEYYNYIIAWCSSNDVMLSFDAGTTDHVAVRAGLAPMRVDVGLRQNAIHGKNNVATADATKLHVVIGYDPSKG